MKLQLIQKLGIFIGVGLGSLLSFSSKANAIIFDFSADDGGFTSSGSPTWAYTGSQWQTDGENNGENFLTSPTLTSTANGAISVSLTHALSFEEPDDYLDGGIVEYSINGSSFTYFDSSALYPSTPLDGVDALGFVEGFGGLSNFRTNSGQDGTLSIGDTFQVRLHTAWDGSVLEPDPAWQVSSIEIENAEATAVPFKFSPTLGLLLVGMGIGLKRGSNCYKAKKNNIDLS